MALQVNIFEAGSVPTAQEIVALISELNTTLNESVTLTDEQFITGVKTFLGSKAIKFKQTTDSDKLGFTLYDPNNKEIGYLEYYNDGRKILALGNYYKSPDNEIETEIGFQISNKVQGASYRILAPLGNKAKQNLPLTGDYTDLYLPLVFVNGAQSVTADDTGKVDLSSLIGSGSGDISGLATVATTGDYGDLINKPTIPVVDLTKAQADELYQPKGDYALTEDLFSGSYNDLTDKPTIPTVPTISTNIANDATSDTKTASPKAVKDFVEGKGYLTEHQDISGKADQTGLEALEDRVDALEQSGSGSGDTTQYSYLKLIPDLDAYTDAPVGEIVKYIGQSNSKYIRGWDYEKVSSGEPQVVKILGDGTGFTKDSGVLTAHQRVYTYTEEIEGLFGLAYSNGLPLMLFSTDQPAVGDLVVYWNDEWTSAITRTITQVDSTGFFIDEDVHINLADLSPCPISKFAVSSTLYCLVKGTAGELTPATVAKLHERFYFENGEYIGQGTDSNGAFIYRENFNVVVPKDTVYIASTDNENYPGPFYPTGKNNYYAIAGVKDSTTFIGNIFTAQGVGFRVGNILYQTNYTDKVTIQAIKPSRIEYSNGQTSDSFVTSPQNSLYIEYVNRNGDLIYAYKQRTVGTKSGVIMIVNNNTDVITATIETATADEDIMFTIGTPSVSWQPILMPTASN